MKITDWADWPELKPEPLTVVDATPDADFPLRILRAYRQNCDCRYATSTDGTCDNPLFSAMNEMQEKRARILDRAIKMLEEAE